MLRFTILLSILFLSAYCASITSDEESAECRIIEGDTLHCSHVDEEHFIEAVKNEKNKHITKINLWHSTMTQLPLQKLIDTGLNKRLIQLSILHHRDIINFDENTFKNYDEIKTLELANTIVHEIKKEHFQLLKKLYRLECTDCGTEKPHMDYLDGVPLKVLSISQTNSPNVPEDFFDYTPTIRILNIDHNKIRNISDKAFRKGTELRVIHLNNNELTRIPKGLFKNLNNLYNLDLSNNPVVDVDLNDIIEGKDNLRNLYIFGWPCSTITKIIQELMKSSKIRCVESGDKVVNGSNCSAVVWEKDEDHQYRLYREDRTFSETQSNSNVAGIPCVLDKIN